MPASLVAPAAEAAPPVTTPLAPAVAKATVWRPSLLATGAAGLQGMLLYGGGIALLHARHNAIGAYDSLVLLAWCLLLYGAGAAITGGGVMLALRLLRRLRSPQTPEAASRSLRRDLWLATAAFHCGFWLFAASYGLTYDEAPGWVRTALAMLGYLALRSAVVLALAAAAARVLLAIGGIAARRRWLLAPTVVLLVALGVAQVALARPGTSAASRPPLPPTLGPARGLRVAVIGIDGADWRVALPMVRRGELPHLARLMEEGSWGPLATFPDSNSAVIWASIYSGRRPAVHGIHDFYGIHLAGMSDGSFGIYPVHRTFFKELALRLQRLGLAGMQPIDRTRVQAPLLWEVASASGRAVGVVDGYYYSFPAPVLADARSFFLAFGSDGTWQQARAAGRAVTAEEAALQAWPPSLLAAESRFLTLPDFRWQTATLLDLLGRYPQPDLLSLYTHEPDAVQHATWRFYEPARFFGVDAATAAARDEVSRFYRELDAFLGRLRARLEPGTVLALVSDHGHSATLFHSMDTQHRHGPPGILLLHGGPVRAGRIDGAHVHDVYPTLLYLLGIPLPADADGRLLRDAIAPRFLAAHPPARIASWDGLPPPRSAVPLDPERQRRQLEQLISLGYVR